MSDLRLTPVQTTHTHPHVPRGQQGCHRGVCVLDSSLASPAQRHRVSDGPQRHKPSATHGAAAQSPAELLMGKALRLNRIFHYLSYDGKELSSNSDFYVFIGI